MGEWPSPGWYRDPGGLPFERWWDGSSWTSASRGLPPWVDPAGNPERSSFSGRRRWLMIGGIVVAAVVAAGVASELMTDDRAVEEARARKVLREGRSAAAVACREFVGRALTSPATAQFSGRESVSGSGPWTVRSTVDSENGFGALVRSRFVCRVSRSGEQWQLLSLTVD